MEGSARKICTRLPRTPPKRPWVALCALEAVPGPSWICALCSSEHPRRSLAAPCTKDTRIQTFQLAARRAAQEMACCERIVWRGGGSNLWHTRRHAFRIARSHDQMQILLYRILLHQRIIRINDQTKKIGFCVRWDFEKSNWRRISCT